MNLYPKHRIESNETPQEEDPLCYETAKWERSIWLGASMETTQVCQKTIDKFILSITLLYNHSQKTEGKLYQEA